MVFTGPNVGLDLTIAILNGRLRGIEDLKKLTPLNIFPCTLICYAFPKVKHSAVSVVVVPRKSHAGVHFYLCSSIPVIASISVNIKKYDVMQIPCHVMQITLYEFLRLFH
jgi:hypothetical protein